ncbi:MAG: hypothetical protein IJ224_02910 [Lachnospiraceae bacterium]|nr:hypothetical protein [Lachnospiraceae bacterium]
MEINEYAYKLMELAKDNILIRYRFFDIALSHLKPVSETGAGCFYQKADSFYYDPVYLLRRYMDEEHIAVRTYMHILLHNILMHNFNINKLDKSYWNLAADIAVENIILDMDFSSASLSRDEEERKIIDMLKKNIPVFTADRIYRFFMTIGISEEAKENYERLFAIDRHIFWRLDNEESQTDNNEIIVSKEDWEKISRRIKTEISNFSKNKNLLEDITDNIDYAVRKRYNYRELLSHFMVMNEEITVNDDEFDYIYYTYGLDTYGNMPLIEPLEYKEDKRIKEFAIALDTSASCSGEIIKKFLTKTYDILKNEESFFNKINLHIIQCDDKIETDTKIESKTEFDTFINNLKLKGNGATDFTPVFDYIEKLNNEKEFVNLKGLIYFTDGYGTFPERIPDYEVMFAFLYEDMGRPKVPGWAMQVVMEDELYEY